jgi:hypothetical protein
MLIALMMQRNRIELLKRIRNLTPRRIQARIQGHALHLRRRHLPALILAHNNIPVAEVDGLRFLDIPEINRVDAAALVGNYGRFGVPE